MSELTGQILVALIPSVLTAVLTAFITVRLSIRRFHSQRWWEKKAETYSSILERISELQFTIGEFLADWEGVRDIGPADSDRVKRLQAMSQEARIAIAKAAEIGSFIVSDEAALVLEKLRKQLDIEDGGDPYDEMGRGYAALKDAIPKIRVEAKKDLRVK